MGSQSGNHSQAETSDLQRQARRLLAWFTEVALPFWQAHGIDGSTGGAWESVSQDGHPETEKNRRSMVQARQMFVFSLAHHYNWLARRGWFSKRSWLGKIGRFGNGQGSENRSASFTAKGICRYLRDHALNPDFHGLYYHSLTPGHQPADQKVDAYDISFNLLAQGWHYRITGQKALLTQADAALATLHASLASDNGGFMEGNYPATWRRQNPHMHLLEAFMCLFEATGDGKWLDEAASIITLFEKHFFNAGVLLEYFDQDWRPARVDGQLLVEPGHLMEWVWLLDRYERLTAQPSSKPPSNSPFRAAPYINALYDKALHWGTDPDSGLLLDAINPAGEVIAASKRLWPQTEAIRTHLIMARLGDDEAEARAARAIAALFVHYLDDRVPGTWADSVDSANRTVAGPSPASSLYHLATAVSDVFDHCFSDR